MLSLNKTQLKVVENQIFSDLKNQKFEVNIPQIIKFD